VKFALLSKLFTNEIYSLHYNNFNVFWFLTKFMDSTIEPLTKTYIVS